MVRPPLRPPPEDPSVFPSLIVILVVTFFVFSVLFSLLPAVVLLVPGSLASKVPRLAKLRRRVLSGYWWAWKLQFKGPVFLACGWCCKKTDSAVVGGIKAARGAAAVETPPATPVDVAAATHVSAKGDGDGERVVNLTWKAGPKTSRLNAPDLFEVVQRTFDMDGRPVRTTALAAGVKSSSDGGVDANDDPSYLHDAGCDDVWVLPKCPPGLTYTFQVRAKNSSGCSPWTEPVVSVTTLQRSEGGGGAGPVAARGCGCKGDRYRWTQNRDEVEVTVPLAPGVTRSDVGCEIGVNRLRLTLQGKEALAGAFPFPVRVSESTWCVDGEWNTVIITLTKRGPSAWESVVGGQPRVHLPQEMKSSWA